MSDHDPYAEGGSDPYDVRPDADRARSELADRIAKEDAWRWLLSDARGMFIVRDLLRAAAPFLPTYVPGDPMGSAYREGQRSVGLALYGEVMQAAPAMWPRLHAMVVGKEPGG